MNSQPEYRGYCKTQRLGRKDIAAVLSSGRRLKGKMLTIQVRGNGLGIARLGLIVPKRYLPLSVDRNVTKRHVREWFRLRQLVLMGRDVLVRFSGPRESVKGLVNELDQLILSK